MQQSPRLHTPSCGTGHTRFARYSQVTSSLPAGGQLARLGSTSSSGALGRAVPQWAPSLHIMRARAHPDLLSYPSPTDAEGKRLPGLQIQGQAGTSLA